MIPSVPLSRRQHWADLNEFSNIAGMRLMFWVFRLFGHWPFRIALIPVLLWYMITKPAARAASRDYLRRVNARAATASINYGVIGVFRHFASFAESILEKLLLWSGLYKTDTVEFYGEEKITAQIASQRGALLICSHLGNLELCRVLAKQHARLKLTLLIHTKHAKRFNQLLARLDSESQLHLMQVTEISPATAMLLAEKIAQGEFVAIAGDRIPVGSNPRIAMAPFLGKSAAFPAGPYLLADLLQCPIYTLFTISTEGATEIHFELFRERVHLVRKERARELNRLAADYAARLEHFCLRAPLQWFNFYDFWHLPSSG